MSNPDIRKEILVCGFGAAARIARMLGELQEEFGEEILLRFAGTQKELVRELGNRHQPVCIVDYPGCYVFPELHALSPETRFVITCHMKGHGIAPEERALYKERKEVLKVIGFVNSKGNRDYLMKLFARTYFGKTWKPKPPGA